MCVVIVGFGKRNTHAYFFLREPMRLRQDSEQIRIRVPFVRAWCAVEIHRVCLVLHEHLHDQTEDVICGVLVGHVSQDV
jgi:hypothetical protein